MKFKRFFYRLSHFPPKIAYALGLGPLLGKFILLLTTRGRKTGKPRVTPLQFEEIGGVIHIASGTGIKADWIRNIQADPHVEVRVGLRHLFGKMELITDPELVTDFMEYRLARHPRMIRLILRMDGLKGELTRDALLSYAHGVVVGRLEKYLGETSN